MNALVVYDSKYGNTKKIAETIALAIGGSAVRVTDFKVEMLQNIQMFIVGSPTQMGNATLRTNFFLWKLKQHDLAGKIAAAFDTGFDGPKTGSAAQKIHKRLIALGCSVNLPAERFIVTGMNGPLKSGEIERAATWAQKINV